LLGGWLGTACTPPDAETAPDRSLGGVAGEEVQGEVEVRIVDHFDGTSERVYRLAREGDPGRLRLAFDRDPVLLPGSRLRAWGHRAGDRV
jgi:hypothetical protein